MKISVIIPCTRDKEVIRAIDSIQSQTYKDIEVIIINDNPDNDISELSNIYSNLDIKLINNSKNIGLSSTRNVGIKESTGKYIYFLDDDDYLNNDRALEDMLNLCTENDTDVALTSTFKDGEYEDIIKSISLTDYYMSVESDSILRPVSTKLYRKKYLTDNNLYFIEGYVAEEDDFLYRLLILNPNISVYNKKVYFYNQSTENSIMKSVKYKEDKAYINILAKERIEKSDLGGFLKSKALMEINNNNRNIKNIMFLF